jgi:hypothetical protein
MGACHQQLTAWLLLLRHAALTVELGEACAWHGKQCRLKLLRWGSWLSLLLLPLACIWGRMECCRLNLRSFRSCCLMQPGCPVQTGQ